MAFLDDEHVIAIARDRYCDSSNDIEIDNDADLSRADEGCWVAAWVWVDYHGQTPEEDK